MNGETQRGVGFAVTEQIPAGNNALGRRCYRDTIRILGQINFDSAESRIMWRVRIMGDDPLYHGKLEGMGEEAVRVALYRHLHDRG